MPKAATKKSKKSAAKATPPRRAPAKNKRSAAATKSASAAKKAAKKATTKVAKKTARPVSGHVAKKAPTKRAAKTQAKKASVAPKPVLPKRPPREDVEVSLTRPSSARRREDGTAFLPDPKIERRKRAKDDLAEELGEDFLAGATGEAVDDARDAALEEEEGGPFVTTTAESQFGHGTDESNPEDAEREPFPTTRSELA